jgi:hypothetical protein
MVKASSSLPYKRMKERADRNTCDLEWSDGDNTLYLAADADPKQVIQHLTNRLFRLDPVLRQAEIIGSQIERRLDAVRQPTGSRKRK